MCKPSVLNVLFELLLEVKTQEKQTRHILLILLCVLSYFFLFDVEFNGCFHVMFLKRFCLFDIID
jgi:hypothetical protein